MAYSIPPELTMDLGNYQTSVLNKTDIIKELKTYKNADFLQYYVDAINLFVERDPKLDIEDVREIKNVANKQINRLRGIDEVVEQFVEVKKETTKFDNISMVCFPKEINERTIEDVRKDVYYIKININGKNELYELSNPDKIMDLIGNIEFMKNISEQELISKLTSNEVSTKLETSDLDMKNDRAVTPQYIKEEVNKIYDTRVRRTFETKIDDVIKERLDLNEYVKKNMPESSIEYALNSNGERIYMVKDKIIKYDDDMNMYFLSENGDKVLTNESFERYNSSFNSVEDVLKEYKETPELLRGKIYLLFEGHSITNEELESIIRFFEICITNEEKGISNDELQDIFNEYYEYAKENNIYPDERLRVIFERKDKLNKSLENDTKELENVYVKKKVLENNYKGFVTTFIVLESSLVLGLIVSLIMLFK